MVNVVFCTVPPGAISRFQNDDWDHAPVMTLDHLTPTWVPAHVDEANNHIWLTSETDLSVEIPRCEPSWESIQRVYEETMSTARKTFIELVKKIRPVNERGTIAVAHRNTMWINASEFRVTFGLGFTTGNAFDEPPWFQPTEAWCPKIVLVAPPRSTLTPPKMTPPKTLWERLNDECLR